MLPGTDSSINTDSRAAAFTSARALLPADADTAEVMRVAEWLLTGSALLDPARVEAAARALHAIGNSHAWAQMGANEQAIYEGRAARVVTAYLTAGHA